MTDGSPPAGASPRAPLATEQREVSPAHWGGAGQVAWSHQEEEAVYRACFEGNSAAMAIIEPDTTISRVNEAYTRVTGYSREEAVGSSWTGLIPPGDRDRLVEYHRRRLQDPASAPDSYEFSFVRRGGGLGYGLMSVSMVPATRRIIASFVDITARRQVEDRLAVSEARHRLLADNARDVVWTMGVDGTITYVSPSVEAVRGFTPAEAMRQTIDQIHPPGSQAISLGYFTKLYADLQAGRPPARFRGELEYRCKDGSTLWTEVMAIPITNADGAVVEILGVTRDLSERKRAEESLRQAEARFRSLAEGAPVGIVETDAEGLVVYANRAAADLAGLSQEALRGRGWFAIVHPADQRRVQDGYASAAASGKVFTSEFQLERSNGQLALVRGFVSALFGKDRRVRGFIGVAADITEERRLREQLAVASQLAALGTVVSGLAHEINSPLGVALASHRFVEEEVRRVVELLRSDAPLERGELARGLEEVVEAEEDAQLGERRIAAIVKDLALLGRPDPRRERVALAKVVEGALGRLPALLKDRAEFQVSDRGAPDVIASEGQLAQVVNNLVSNAIRAVPGDRTAVVSVELGLAGPGRASLQISDQGVGMTPEVMARMFDPFFSTREVGQGTGLGLSICHAVVKSHGGSITATSAPGRGSTFTVELPAAVEE